MTEMQTQKSQKWGPDVSGTDNAAPGPPKKKKSFKDLARKSLASSQASAKGDGAFNLDDFLKQVSSNPTALVKRLSENRTSEMSSSSMGSRGHRSFVAKPEVEVTAEAPGAPNHHAGARASRDIGRIADEFDEAMDNIGQSYDSEADIAWLHERRKFIQALKTLHRENLELCDRLERQGKDVEELIREVQADKRQYEEERTRLRRETEEATAARKEIQQEYYNLEEEMMNQAAAKDKQIRTLQADVANLGASNDDASKIFVRELEEQRAENEKLQQKIEILRQAKVKLETTCAFLRAAKKAKEEGEEEDSGDELSADTPRTAMLKSPRFLEVDLASSMAKSRQLHARVEQLEKELDSATESKREEIQRVQALMQERYDMLKQAYEELKEEQNHMGPGEHLGGQRRSSILAPGMRAGGLSLMQEDLSQLRRCSRVSSAPDEEAETLRRLREEDQEAIRRLRDENEELKERLRQIEENQKKKPVPAIPPMKGVPGLKMPGKSDDDARLQAALQRVRSEKRGSEFSDISVDSGAKGGDGGKTDLRASFVNAEVVAVERVLQQPLSARQRIFKKIKHYFTGTETPDVTISKPAGEDVHKGNVFVDDTEYISLTSPRPNKESELVAKLRKKAKQNFGQTQKEIEEDRQKRMRELEERVLSSSKIEEKWKHTKTAVMELFTPRKRASLFSGSKGRRGTRRSQALPPMPQEGEDGEVGETQQPAASSMLGEVGGRGDGTPIMDGVADTRVGALSEISVEESSFVGHGKSGVSGGLNLGGVSGVDVWEGRKSKAPEGE
uniref:Uncharacterized protein n=1 Tax=Chromera velia CCMP2878 TaxID=1169474 RepID=A0A0G4FPU2_9ALVE|eukprot:Cvel_3609.t1-p1 / transcript=Cvel_3609.t1 / gene=Cvel_3609 / organism=Chromera_velia_CCMP2878 / gene_product=hypothetical protein / transcript_product=hypothetical protein / location=Cvel_scaffold148:42790-45599(-) / protein_length=789 / sequence_SO=supercontig / SO=protein_coding / is_pseudo=false